MRSHGRWQVGNGYLNLPIEQSVASYLQLVRRIRPVHCGIVATMPPPPRDGSASRVRALNDALRGPLQREGVEILDLPEVIGRDGMIVPQFTGDQIHLNAAGYRVWEDKLRSMHVG